MQTIPPQILDAPLHGQHVAGTTLRQQISDQPTLLVFLRHFGCLFCQELIRDLRAIRAEMPDYPPVLFFYQGTPEEGEAVFQWLWPEACAVSDIPKTFYNAFNVERGGLNEMFGPEVWACGLRALTKGNFVGWKTGDPWTLPAFFLVHGDRVDWAFHGDHAGDHPDLRGIPQRIPGAAGRTSSRFG